MRVSFAGHWLYNPSHGQQTDRPYSPRNRATSGNRRGHHRPLPQLRKGGGTNRWTVGIDRATCLGARKTGRASGNWRAHGGTSTRNREDGRLCASEKTVEEISGDDSGFAATAIARAQE